LEIFSEKWEYFDRILVEQTLNPSGRTHQDFNHSKGTRNEEDLGLQQEKGVELWILSKKKNYHSSSSSSCVVLCISPLLLMLRWGAHMIVKALGSLPACSLKSAGRKGRQAHKMCTCTHCLPTFLATPSNFISLPLAIC
jgi:hypothetical protein